MIRQIEALSGQSLDIKVTNQSRARREDDMARIDLAALRARLASEYAIYDAIADG